MPSLKSMVPEKKIVRSTAFLGMLCTQQMHCGQSAPRKVVDSPKLGTEKVNIVLHTSQLKVPDRDSFLIVMHNLQASN